MSFASDRSDGRAERSVILQGLRDKWPALLRFAAGGVLSAGVTLGVTALLHEVFAVPGAEGRRVRDAGRAVGELCVSSLRGVSRHATPLASASWCCSLLRRASSAASSTWRSLPSTSGLGVHYLLALMGVLGASFLLKFTVYEGWMFARRAETPGSRRMTDRLRHGAWIDSPSPGPGSWLAAMAIGCWGPIAAVSLRAVESSTHRPMYDELLHVLSARGVMQTGEPVMADGIYGRAELFTRLVAASMTVFGDSLVAARLPALVSGGLLVLLVSVWTTRRVGWVAGLCVALLLASLPMSVSVAVFARFYTLHALFVALGMILAYEATIAGRTMRRPGGTCGRRHGLFPCGAASAGDDGHCGNGRRGRFVRPVRRRTMGRCATDRLEAAAAVARWRRLPLVAIGALRGLAVRSAGTVPVHRNLGCRPGRSCDPTI